MFVSKLKIAGSLIAAGALIAGTGAIARQQGGADSTSAVASTVTTSENGRPVTKSQSSSSSASATVDSPATSQKGSTEVTVEAQPFHKGGSLGRGVNDRALEREDEEDEKRNELIRQVLLKPMPMPFGQPTPLEDVFKYIKTATISPKLPSGIPIYIDPKTLEKLQKPDVVIDMDDVRLKTSLRLILRQVDLGYYIRDGLLMIESRNSLEFHRVSQEELNAPPVPDPEQEQPPQPE